jgi:hypothetical protein
MNTESLKQKRSVAEAKFNELVEQKKQIDEELLKLQGEYRSLTSLIEESEPKPEEANTIVVEPKKVSKKNG